jgi:hypothetical protein
MTACPLAAVGCTRGKTSIALAADLLVAFVFGGQDLHGRFDYATTKTEDQMKGRFFLDVIIAKRSSIFELLSSENKTLLVRRDPVP